MIEWVRDVDLKNQASFVLKKDPSVIHRETAVTISTFIPPGLYERLCTFPPDHYLLGVGYASKGDLQLGVTGTACYGETPRQAVTREVQEETGLVMKDETALVSIGAKSKARRDGRGKPRRYLFFSATPESLDFASFAPDNKGLEPNKSVKVVFLVHGLLATMEALIQRIGSLDGRPSDGIDRFAAIPIPDAIELARTLPSTC